LSGMTPLVDYLSVALIAFIYVVVVEVGRK
jgi:hypothetical protein